jgi:pyrroloquinoline quinone biosynthesis protein B
MNAPSGLYFRASIAAASFLIIGCIWFVSCRSGQDRSQSEADLPDRFALVLGVAQDAGYPQIGCVKTCCLAFRNGDEPRRLVTSVALVDRTRDHYWLLEATPDVGEQLHRVSSFLGRDSFRLPAGVLLTHAHIGHYAGLMQFGREAFGARELPVYAMPRMSGFLQSNGPWSQLVETGNITLRNLQSDSTVDLGGSFRITPFRVPHRDEYSETVGFVVEGDRRIVFLPDIDKWEKWDRELLSLDADLYLIDGTFLTADEVPGRDMREIPHPFVTESLHRFAGLPDSVRSKIVFIHFNHTNPLIRSHSKARDSVLSKGFRVAEEGAIIPL